MADNRRTDTRERILDAALDLMSERGYGGVTIRDIADAVGIKGASLYKHFKGKADLFDALVARETRAIEDTLRDAGANATLDDDPAIYDLEDAEALEDLVWASYAPFFLDGRVKKLRRMLEVSRYSDERCAKLYDAIFVARPLALQRRIFDTLVKRGAYEPCDTALAAQQFHGPMLMLIGAEVGAESAEDFCARHLKTFKEVHERKRP